MTLYCMSCRNMPRYRTKIMTFTIFCDSYLLTRLASLTSSTLGSRKSLHKEEKYKILM